jgi:diguanylate cyclase (GGDEF)-like protein
MRNQNIFRWNLNNKISSLAAILLLLLGSVSFYFYAEINKISRETEELINSDLQIYETVQNLISNKQRTRLLLKELESIQKYTLQDQRLRSSEDVVRQLIQINQDIIRLLSEGVEQTEFAIQDDLPKKGRTRVDTGQEDYHKIQKNFLDMRSKSQDSLLLYQRILWATRHETIAKPEVLIHASYQDAQRFNELAENLLMRLRENIRVSMGASLEKNNIVKRNIFVITIGVLLIGIYWSKLITKKIIIPIQNVTYKAKFIAENIEREDLIFMDLELSSDNEITDLVNAFNHMVKNVLKNREERALVAQKILSEKESVEWQANHDALTGLMNRRAFENELMRSLNSNDSNINVLLYLDLDRFKIINDTCGHTAGDKLLQQVSQLFSTAIRKSDTLARVGGDEFAAILYGCRLDQAQEVAENILQKIQEFCFVWQDQHFSIGVSIGVVSFHARQGTLSSILGAADAACYSAKNNGRNQVCIIQDEVKNRVKNTPEIEALAEIHQALKDRQFCLFYQTIQPLQSQDSHSEYYEVLLRLEGKDGRLIYPAVYMPIAERYQLMGEIDRWVIQTLFAEQGSHYRQQADVSAAKHLQKQSFYTINLSSETVNDSGFVDFVKDALAQYQIPPDLICFEITETVAIANYIQAKQMIHQIKALGCHFALDNFGSGISSFNHLKTLPVDFLKIDGSFIQALPKDPINRLLVQSFSQVSQGMGIATIAEFVDSEETIEQLREIGIDYAQGYWISEPQPLQELQPLTAL